MSDTPFVESPSPPGIAGLPDRLEQLRAHLAISVNAFAKLCGVPNSAMRTYLGRRSLPSVESLDGIARATGTSLQWLVRGAGAPTGIDRKLLSEIVEIVAAGILPPTITTEKRSAWAQSVADEMVLFYSLATVGGPQGVFPVETLREMRERMMASLAGVRSLQVDWRDPGPSREA